MEGLKRTPLYPLYAKYGAKTVEFGGWEMPVQFSGILDEHQAVRERVGLFDVSHMGEFEVRGSDAQAFLQKLVTNDVSRLQPGMAMYSPMTYESGTCVDDLLVYRFDSDRFWVVVNAGNIDKDFAWMMEHTDGFDVRLENQSTGIALLALQGPLAQAVLQPLTPVDLENLAYYRFVEGQVGDLSVVISRTGYTGEDGFEFYTKANDAERLWELLLTAGKDQGIAPCGLGARDTLRLEARLPLYGHELTDEISPLEVGLGIFVKLNKGDFVGRAALAEQKENGIPRKLVGLELLERGIPRADYRVYSTDASGSRDIGFVTSGTMSPTLKQPIGLALIERSYGELETELEVEIRGKRVRAKVVPTPFYKRPKK